MKTIISVYELLGLIKDGKAPYSILFKNEVWFWGYDTYTTYECLCKTPDSQISLFNKYRIDYCLNDKVEIIDNGEDKPIIEKLDLFDDLQDILNSNDQSIILNAIHKCLTAQKYKLNEVIDYINRKENK